MFRFKISQGADHLTHAAFFFEQHVAQVIESSPCLHLEPIIMERGKTIMPSAAQFPSN